MTSDTPRNLIMERRRTEMLKACRSISTRKLPVIHRLQHSKHYKFLYCPIAKIGSTFWTRLFYQIRNRQIASPYNIKPQIHLPDEGYLNEREKGNMDIFLKNYTSILFVRNPYTRLFSAYIDKLYSPNPMYWHAVGKRVIEHIRKVPTPACAHDITFTEFIQYTVHCLENGRQPDAHVQPIWDVCSPCKAQYDIIGTMETIREDTDHILDTFHLGDYKKVLKSFSEDAINDGLYDTAQAYVEMRRDAEKCMSKTKIAERIWMKLQIRGFIAIDMEVPDALSDFKLNEMDVLTLFKDGHQRSVAKHGRLALKRQKGALFAKAYRNVPIDTIRKVPEVYRKDFWLFGYDEHFIESLLKSNATEVDINNFKF